jgi:hypothetical protein
VSPIFNTAGTSPAGEVFATGAMPGEGTYFCLVCGTQVSLHETDALPSCAGCGASRFRRDSIFSSLQEHGSPTVEFAIEGEPEPPPWLEEAQARLSGSGPYLAMRERGRIETFALREGWTRIGRCSTAQICLDDRSLNGIAVNGRNVDVAELEPGDELKIGRLRLYLLQA